MKKFLISIGLILILSATALVLLFNISKEKDYSPQEFLINSGDKTEDIAQKLQDQGLIFNKYLFLIYNYSTQKFKNLQAGNYLLSPSMDIIEITEKINNGEIIEEKITIIEGWTINEIADYLENKNLFLKEVFLENIENHSQEYDFLEDKPKDLGLEGYLFPDTYFISQKTPQNIIDQMLSNFNNKLSSQLKEEIQKQGKTIFEIITVASLIEKEVKTFEDKKNVSDIIWKRLDVGMPLQIDATIVYITGKKTTTISSEETQIDSEYNTYKYKGLPKGPICNPGIESILAAIYPSSNQYFYYLSTKEGETIFSKTLEEHNIAKQKYIKTE